VQAGIASEGFSGPFIGNCKMAGIQNKMVQEHSDP
jgi:hypothetical protein